jgi:hypothetical protein
MGEMSRCKSAVDTESLNDVREKQPTVTAEKVAKHIPPTISRKWASNMGFSVSSRTLMNLEGNKILKEDTL